jgi:hypothetical protein
MRPLLDRANPFQSLRLRLCLLVFGAIAALVVFMSGS